MLCNFFREQPIHETQSDVDLWVGDCLSPDFSFEELETNIKSLKNYFTVVAKLEGDHLIIVLLNSYLDLVQSAIDAKNEKKTFFEELEKKRIN